MFAVFPKILDVVAGVVVWAPKGEVAADAVEPPKVELPNAGGAPDAVLPKVPPTLALGGEPKPLVVPVPPKPVFEVDPKIEPVGFVDACASLVGPPN